MVYNVSTQKKRKIRIRRMHHRFQQKIANHCRKQISACKLVQYLPILHTFAYRCIILASAFSKYIHFHVERQRCYVLKQPGYEPLEVTYVLMQFVFVQQIARLSPSTVTYTSLLYCRSKFAVFTRAPYRTSQNSRLLPFYCNLLQYFLG